MNFVRLLLALVLTSLAFSAVADMKVFNLECGGASINIKAAYPADDPGRMAFASFEMTVTRDTRSVSPKLNHGYLYLSCLTNSTGQKMIVLQNFCEGTVCHGSEGYGIIDPRTLKIRLNPAHRNKVTAARILGLKRVPSLLDHPERVCCEH